MPPRERYEAEGPAGFGDVELLALVLGTGTAGRSAIQIAASLLHHFGGLAGVSARQPHELRGVAGIGLERAVRLHASLEAGRRAVQRELTGDPVTCAVEAWRVLEPGLRGRVEEELHALYLDRRHRPVARRRLTRGSDGFTVVDPRHIYRVGVGVGACAVILAHNHPSGDPAPSRQDLRITDRVARAGRILGIPLLDHLVIGAGTFRSLAEEGSLCSWTPSDVEPWARDYARDMEPACYPRCSRAPSRSTPTD